MIVSLILDLLKALFLFIINLFPTIPSTGIAAFIEPAKRLIHGINLVISVPLLGTCLTLIIVFYNIRFIWSIIMWVVRKIPGVS